MKTITSRRIHMSAVLVTMSVLVSVGTSEAALITKAPDGGPFWHPLSPTGGTYVYADSSVPQQTSTVVDLGTWLTTQLFDPNTAVTFQVWGSVGNNPASGPDAGNVLASTAGISGINGSLTFYSAPVSGSQTLIAGNTYWFVATVVGATGLGTYQVGAHTQNSGGIVDNGTFWYSNDPAGVNFDGRALIPEMAFQVDLADGVLVPEPTTTLAGALLILPFVVQGLRHLRVKRV